MASTLIHRLGLFCLAPTILLSASLQAQALKTLTANAQERPATACGPGPFQPATLPPSTSGPVVYLIALCFEPQGYRSPFPEKYLQDIHLKPSSPSRGMWTPYDAAAEKAIFEDYQRIWNNNALANLSIDIRDLRFPNGVIGKIVTYSITEKN
jgi:hypothetical protein